MEKYPAVEDLAHANPDELLEMLRPLGLLKRSTFLRAAAGMVVDLYGGKVPNSEKELLKLPGVGLYVARSGKRQRLRTTNCRIGHQRFPDTVEVLRFEGQRIKSRDKELWALAQEMAPPTEVSRWNLTLLDFGAKVCTAPVPKCRECPLSTRCCYGQELLKAS